MESILTANERESCIAARCPGRKHRSTTATAPSGTQKIQNRARLKSGRAICTCPASAFVWSSSESSVKREPDQTIRCLQDDAMFILSMPWDLRSLWAMFTVTAKLYVFCLMMGAAYSSYSLALIAAHHRQIVKHLPSTDKNISRARLSKLTTGIQTVRQVHLLLLLLFGTCCANEGFAALRAIRYSSTSLYGVGVEAFEPVAAFSFLAFAVLLFVHVFQWAVAHRLQLTVVND
jgi:hypothetical protein